MPTNTNTKQPTQNDGQVNDNDDSDAENHSVVMYHTTLHTILHSTQVHIHSNYQVLHHVILLFLHEVNNMGSLFVSWLCACMNLLVHIVHYIHIYLDLNWCYLFMFYSTHYYSAHLCYSYLMVYHYGHCGLFLCHVSKVHHLLSGQLL